MDIRKDILLSSNRKAFIILEFSQRLLSLWAMCPMRGLELRRSSTDQDVRLVVVDCAVTQAPRRESETNAREPNGL